jgi:hypothetical protein
VALSPSEFILPVVDPVVLLEAHVNQAVVSLPTIAVDSAATLNMTSDKGE